MQYFCLVYIEESLAQTHARHKNPCSSFSVSDYCRRICSWMNHLTSSIMLSDLLISRLTFNSSVCRFNSFFSALSNLTQYWMTCVTVSLIWSHEQTDEEKSDIWTLFQKRASSMCCMQICVIIKLSVFWSFIYWEICSSFVDLSLLRHIYSLTWIHMHILVIKFSISDCLCC